MTEPSPKHQLYELFARVAKAMASAPRLELLEALGQGERSVDALAQASHMSVANTSHHLQILKDSGLAESRKEGLQVFYSLADPAIPAVLAGIRGIAERRLAEVARIVRESFESKDSLEPLSRDELMRLARAGEVMVIDVRPETEYAAGHIPGAVNVPLEALPERLDSLPQGQEIVAYCRGPYCMLAFEAVDQLRGRGFKARRLEEGFPEWKADRRPVEKDR